MENKNDLSSLKMYDVVAVYQYFHLWAFATVRHISANYIEAYGMKFNKKTGLQCNVRPISDCCEIRIPTEQDCKDMADKKNEKAFTNGLQRILWGENTSITKQQKQEIMKILNMKVYEPNGDKLELC